MPRHARPVQPAPAADPFGLRWRAPLPPFQQVGIAWLLETPGVLLADDMGLGKAIQAIAALRVMFARATGGEAPGATPEPALVVVPDRLVPQWRKQFRDWAPELTLSACTGTPDERLARWQAPAQVCLAGFDALRGDMALPAPHGPRHRMWGVVVADEARRARTAHPASAAAVATVKALPRRRAWALAGAPVEDAPDDALSILDFVAPGLCRPGEMMAGLRQALAVVQLRRRRADVLHELPPGTVLEVAPALLPPQREAHDAVLRDGVAWLRSLGPAVQVTHVLDLILRLQQICNACPHTGASAKMDDLVGRLDDVAASGGKSLVFTQFVSAPSGAEAIAAAAAPLRPVLLTGRMAPAARNEAVAAFTADPSRRVMVASVRAGALGLDLAAASSVFHFDRWWAPAAPKRLDVQAGGQARAQGGDRARRVGQARPMLHRVQAFAYLTPDSIEQRVGDVLHERRALFGDIVDGVATPSLRRLGLPELLRAVGA